MLLHTPPSAFGGGGGAKLVKLHIDSSVLKAYVVTLMNEKCCNSAAIFLKYYPDQILISTFDTQVAKLTSMSEFETCADLLTHFYTLSSERERGNSNRSSIHNNAKGVTMKNGTTFYDQSKASVTQSRSVNDLSNITSNTNASTATHSNTVTIAKPNSTSSLTSLHSTSLTSSSATLQPVDPVLSTLTTHHIVQHAQSLIAECIQNNQAVALRAAGSLCEVMGFAEKGKEIRYLTTTNKLNAFVKKGKWQLALQSVRTNVDSQMCLFNCLKEDGQFIEANVVLSQCPQIRHSVVSVNPEALQAQIAANQLTHLSFPVDKVRIVTVNSVDSVLYAAQIFGYKLKEMVVSAQKADVKVSKQNAAQDVKTAGSNNSGGGNKKTFSAITKVDASLPPAPSSSSSSIANLRAALGVAPPSAPPSLSGGEKSNSSNAVSTVGENHTSHPREALPLSLIEVAWGLRPPSTLVPSSDLSLSVNTSDSNSSATVSNNSINSSESRPHIQIHRHIPPFRLVVGLDSEWKVVMYQGNNDSGASILQISTPTHAFLFDLTVLGSNRLSSATLSRNLFSDATVLKVGWGFMNEDCKMIRKASGGRFSSILSAVRSFTDLDDLIDTRDMQLKRSGCEGMDRHGVMVDGGEINSKSLSNACQRFLGRSLNKFEQLSDWGARQLTTAQQQYACLDAHCLLALLDVVLMEKNVSGDVDST
eukprot:gene23595-29831_t